MERQFHSLGSIATSLGLFLGVCLLLSSAKAENKTNPTANQNLSPVQAWRSAEYCLANTSTYCGDKYTLRDSGWLNVTHDKGQWFCTAGCAEHTRWVLLCLAHVHKDYWFENGATIKNINDTINIGCDPSQGFNGTSLYNSAYKLNSVPIFTALSATALLLITLF